MLPQPRRRAATRFAGAALCACRGRQSATRAGGLRFALLEKSLHGPPRGAPAWEAMLTRRRRIQIKKIPACVSRPSSVSYLDSLAGFPPRLCSSALLPSTLHSLQSQRKMFSAPGHLVRLRGSCPGKIRKGYRDRPCSEGSMTRQSNGTSSSCRGGEIWSRLNARGRPQSRSGRCAGAGGSNAMSRRPARARANTVQRGTK